MALLHSHASHHPSMHPILAFALCINLIHLPLVPHYSLWQVTVLFATTNLEVDRNTLRLFDLALVYSGGTPSLFTPVDDQHPVFMGPRDCTLTVGGPRRDVVPGRTLLRSLWGDASTGSVPQGLQPNGLMLYPMAFPSDIHQPSISSTIPGSIGLQARICWPECGALFQVGQPVNFTASLPVETRGPYSYQWSTTQVRAPRHPGAHIVLRKGILKLVSSCPMQ
jgi:hypothetical protein